MVVLKTIGLALLCLITQYLFGWLVPLIICFLAAGFLFEKHIILTVTLIGTVLNGAPTIYYYITYDVSAEAIINDLSIIFGKIDAFIVMLISFLIPIIMYAIAGVFAWQIAEIKRKLSV